jgi:hypothetical protein
MGSLALTWQLRVGRQGDSVDPLKPQISLMLSSLSSSMEIQLLPSWTQVDNLSCYPFDFWFIFALLLVEMWKQINCVELPLSPLTSVASSAEASPTGF